MTRDREVKKRERKVEMTKEKEAQVEDEAVESAEENLTKEEQESVNPDEEIASGDNLESENEEDSKESSDNDNEEEDEDSEEDKAEALSAKYEELNGKYLRLYAEFENFRKRTAKENIQLMFTANGNLLEKLIPTLENFQLAFSPEKKASKLEDFEKGMKMIYNTFKDVLEEAGMEEINPEGEEFDPELHEAMLQQYHDKVEEDHVIQVYQKGYKLKTKILKHAKVIISKGKEPKAKKK